MSDFRHATSIFGRGINYLPYTPPFSVCCLLTALYHFAFSRASRCFRVPIRNLIVVYRRRLTPETSIINALNEQLASGIENPHFTIAANFNEGVGLFASTEEVEIDVVLTEPSVTQATSYSVDGGASVSVNTTAKYFVSAQSSHETLSNTFSILAIDQDTGEVSGLVQKDGKLFKLEQRQGTPTLVTEVNFEPPRDWECKVLHGDLAPCWTT